MIFDEAGGGEFAQACFIEAAPRVKVEVFEGGLQFQFGTAQTVGELPVGAQRMLAFDEESETVVEAQCVGITVVELFFERLRHAVQAHGLELVEGGVI